MEPTTKHAHSLMILSKSSTSTVSSMVIDLFFTEKSWKCNSFELLLLADKVEKEHTRTLTKLQIKIMGIKGYKTSGLVKKK